MVDSTGRIVYAPANLLLRSQEFDNAYWAKLGSTVTANTTAAPDGTQTADKLAEDATTAPHYVTRAAADFTAGSTYTLSVYAKASERQWVAVGFNNEANRLAWFNLSTGVVGTVQPSIMATSIQSVGDGWYRCSVTSAVSTTNPYPSAMVANADGVSSYAGTAGSGIFIWGAQLEPVTYQTAPGPYVATTASAYYGPRFDYNPFTLGALGLLIEEQRTNLFTYSADFTNAAWGKVNLTATGDATTAPDGTTTADRLAVTATGVSTVGNRSIASITGTAAAYTVYVKQGTSATVANGFALRNSTTATDLVVGTLNYTTGVWTYTTGSTGVTVQDAGNGWWRLSLTASSGITSGDTLTIYYGYVGGTSVTAGDHFFIWGAQLEVGAFATSYIPTVASQVTRNADVASMTGTNFSGWYNQTEGTFVAGADCPAVGTHAVFAADDGTASNTVRIRSSAADPFYSVRAGGVEQANLDAGTITANTAYQQSGAYAANNFATSLNGATVVTDTSGSIPTVSRLALGADANGNYLNGHIRQIAYFNTRLPDAQLETLSSPSLVPTLVLDFTASSYASGY
jgi:hypothetical protein